jgi:PAS domain S-box-containing protein
VTKKRKAPRRPRAGIRELRNRLHAAEATVRAIQSGEVDALVVARPSGEQVVTLAGAELAYRILFDQMNEGAVTLARDGLIVYCNRRFADIVRTPWARVVGAPLRRFAPPAEQEALEVLLQGGSRENARGDLRFRAGDGSSVPVAVSFAPLRAEGSADVIGVVGVIRDITERERQNDLRTRLIEQVMTAQDEERRRIARELHDETGQSLTALLVGLRTIEGSKTVGQAVELAQRLRETTAQTLVDVGRLWRGLHPGVLDDLGLAAAVTRHAEEFADAHRIGVNVQAEGLDADGLSPLLQATVYRVLQEALTNVARHAGARRVDVRLVRGEGSIELHVQDDGAGFKPGNSGRLGLRGMRERAALLGGSIDVESQPGAGTTITARIPVRSQ